MSIPKVMRIIHNFHLMKFCSDKIIHTAGQSSGEGTGASLSKNFISKDWYMGGPAGTEQFESLSSLAVVS